MWRKIGAVVAGLVAWIVIVSLLNRGLRLWLPGYSAVETAMTFTLTMKIARLAIAAVSSLCAGVVTRAIARFRAFGRRWIVGLVLVRAVRARTHPSVEPVPGLVPPDLPADAGAAGCASGAVLVPRKEGLGHPRAKNALGLAMVIIRIWASVTPIWRRYGIVLRTLNRSPSGLAWFSWSISPAFTARW